MQDQLWEHYNPGTFQPHQEPNYITQQYIKYLENEVNRLKKLITEGSKSDLKKEIDRIKNANG